MGWYYRDKPVNEISDMEEGAQLFIYLITNLDTKRKYIGKKNLYFIKRKMVKGKRKRVKVESDWRIYFGSNDTLKAEAQDLGEDKFKREILHFCKSKGVANYLELREQIDRRVLESDEYYNEYVGTKVNQSHLKKM